MVYYNSFLQNFILWKEMQLKKTQKTIIFLKINFEILFNKIKKNAKTVKKKLNQTKIFSKNFIRFN